MSQLQSWCFLYSKYWVFSLTIWFLGNGHYRWEERPYVLVRELLSNNFFLNINQKFPTQLLFTGNAFLPFGRAWNTSFYVRAWDTKNSYHVSSLCSLSKPNHEFRLSPWNSFQNPIISSLNLLEQLIQIAKIHTIFTFYHFF